MTDPAPIRDNGDSWSDDEITQLRELAECSTPAHIIGLNLGRSENAVRSKACETGIPLDPRANRGPVMAKGRDRTSPVQRRATDRSRTGHGVRVADEQLQRAILTTIKVAEGPQRSLVSLTDLAELVQTRLHASSRELAAAVEVLYRGGLITGLGDLRTGLRFVRLTGAGRSTAEGGRQQGPAS